MPRASTYTLLALDRYAQIMGIAPPHFASVTCGPNIFATDGNCSPYWWQHPWQNYDQVSREDLARAILDAEGEIAQQLGFWPAPTWIRDEEVKFPDYYDPTMYSFDDITKRGKGLPLRWGRIVQGGVRAVSLIGTATTVGGTLVYSDADSDGLIDTATITLPTSLTDSCDIKVYFAGHGGEPEWEIRPARTSRVSGGNVIKTFYSWQMINPALWEVFPTLNGMTPIDITSIPPAFAAAQVTSVDVYWEKSDATLPDAVFYWGPDGLCSICGGTGCSACQLSHQDGCFHIRDAQRGIVVAGPAVYDAATATWTGAPYSYAQPPDTVRISYQSGERSQRFLSGATCDPLSDYWAYPIAWIATCRLDRPFCGCGAPAAYADELRNDLALVPQGNLRYTTKDILSSPFGTHYGEVLAWKRVKNFVGKKMNAAVIS